MIRDTRAQIRDAAHGIGFQLCGFARIDESPHAEFLRQWLDGGNAASMAYIERGLAKRINPRLIFPKAQTVITLGYRYLPPPLPPVDWREQLRGRIAAYAFGTDYHETVVNKLNRLAEFLKTMDAAAIARPYVDTGPILEREWAAASGIGWFGKNTNLLHTENGSYFFLGELLTNLELEPDPPVADHCGTCTRCLDLCPTDALKPGFLLDARRCIAYLTIEHRGAIPIELRGKLGNWIFGCDICQEVCPWNEKLTRQHGMPDSEALLPYLPGLLQLNDEQFRSRFGRSAIRRAKRDGLLRNVAVVLGNTGNPAAIAPLAEALRHDGASLVRAHAAWALGAIGGSNARSALIGARQPEDNREVRDEIEAALAR